ncbi:MAG: glycoside hydrolase family 43 protein [Planctomycetes bacterium]|nr:glycoside hydrolase family 43 protein [Planctomycetota bacterium]
MGSTIANPIIPGYHPDPSICRVGDNFYIVNSSNEYAPGIPIHHSRDLVHWRQIGHCLTRPAQLPLTRAACSHGIFAPTIRHHDGRFVVVTTNTTSGGNILVTASDPRGPWSDPLPLAQEGIDPSLLFDDDGAVYLTTTNARELLQSRIDLASGRILDGPRPIWAGTGGRYLEGPHLFHVDGRYVLIAAEGGTEYGHYVICARAPTPWGPFEAAPHNPILSHRDHPRHPIQGVGHADLVQLGDGSWWAVCLGFRPQNEWHHLGRETCLAPVVWKHGWPHIHDRTLGEGLSSPALPAHPWPTPPVRDDFTGETLDPWWTFLRTAALPTWRLGEPPGILRLLGAATTLDDEDHVAWVGRRQQHLVCRVAASLDVTPRREGELAGICLLQNARHHIVVAIALRGGERRVFVRRRIGDLAVVTHEAPLPPGPAVLSIAASPLLYRFSCVGSDGRAIDLGSAETRSLSKEVAGGFTGVMIGMYATGSGVASGVPADFDWFEYAGA